MLVDKGDIQEVADVAVGALTLSQANDGFGLVVVEVGVMFELVDSGGVDVEFADGGGVDGDIWQDVSIAGRVHAIYFEQLVFVHKSSQQGAVAHDAAGKCRTYVVELLEVEGVGSVEFDNGPVGCSH